MKTSFGTWLSALAICAMAFPVQALEPSAVAAPVITDVTLSATGDFLGVVVDDTGKPLANAPIRVLYNNTVVATAKTNASGRYTVKSLRSGLHTVQTAQNSQACRIWDAAMAPPSAKRGLVMASTNAVLRGQYCDDGCGQGCGEGCGEACGGGCGLFGGGALGGALLPIGIFATVAAVTVASSTGNDSSQPVGQQPPASP